MSNLTRRDFVRAATFSAAAMPLVGMLKNEAAAANEAPAQPEATDGKVARLRWLEGKQPAATAGVTWGVPWPRGLYPKDTTFVLRGANQSTTAVQSWPLAYWPDGSLKFTGHALAADIPEGEAFELAAGKTATTAAVVTVSEQSDAIEVDTSVIRARLPKSGRTPIASISREGKEILRNGRLVALRDDRPAEGGGTVQTDFFESEISQVTVEQKGPLRAVIRVEGKHRAEAKAWLPFCLRFYFHAGGETVRIMHSFVFDGDENKDFIRGLGVRFEVLMRDLMHDRHVRFVGEGSGLWAEAVRGLTGLRRDPDERRGGGGPRDREGVIKKAQIAGKACPPLDTFSPAVRERLEYVPAWGDHTLSQLTAGAFAIRKRTKAGHGWIDVDQGGRAAGVGYVGGATGGGVAFGLRDFWQRHPTQLDIRGANTDVSEVTLWMWSPSAPAMDMRFYHDGMGMDTYEKQYHGGLDITYEDYEPGWGTAHGIARSSEIMLWVLPSTPSRERMIELADAVRTPALLAASPAHLLAARVFGGLWGLPDRSTPTKAAIEDRLDWQFDYHRRQVEQRHWYGFWNYGDVMHAYDQDRHVWRYDVGGFAWDNSELSTDLWLWYAFLRSGRADIFRFAEAMTRHTGEVDVYHLGRFAGLGSRHNVQHWGCSAKQVRISTPVYRRFYYYLTADERVGDLMREVIDTDQKLEMVDPARKLEKAPPKGDFLARVSYGTDWCNLAAAWLVEWERGGDPKYRDKLLRGMKDLGAMPAGFFTSERFGYTIDGGLHALPREQTGGLNVSHLDAVFGAVEICAELIQLTAGQPEFAGFEKAWLQYCELYNASPDVQRAALGRPLEGNGLRQNYSRLTAYVASRKKDEALAKRAWAEFLTVPQEGGNRPRVVGKLSGPMVLNPVEEAAWVSTNDSAQWGLAAIECLALIGDKMTAP